ncbi:uncharacterized protein LOC130721305 [Lotus japonicus]|uniref:uncharacterized protein LOC130721305 n=1 Tax=Lotus japonicus TaxID=34305 RepID=UPI0025887558|nr:uncharacterized protein LOC130721305 [Lotus japonicus]
MSKKNTRGVKRNKASSSRVNEDPGSDLEVEMERQSRRSARARSDTQFDTSKFKSSVTAMHYGRLRSLRFIEERRVELGSNEFPDFQKELEERGWMKLAKPPRYFNHEVVRQFYANSLFSEEAKEQRKSWVNGIQVNYDKDTINNCLGNPWDPHTDDEDDLCDYQTQELKGMNHLNGFSKDKVRKKLCIEGLDTTKMKGGIYRACMKQLPLIWMNFLVTNMLPSSHVSDLPLTKACLVYSILEQDSVNIAAVISDHLAKCIGNGVKSMIFPALIHELCKLHNVPMNADNELPLQYPITAAYIQQNCKENDLDTAKAEFARKLHETQPEQPEQVPPTHEPQSSQMDQILSQLQHMQEQWSEIQSQQAEDRVQRAEDRLLLQQGVHVC